MVGRDKLRGDPMLCPECFWEGVDGELTLSIHDGVYVCPQCGNTNVELNLHKKEGIRIPNKNLMYCDTCDHLHPKEHNQGSKENHVCMVLCTRVYHNGHHPHIVAAEECPKRKN